MFGMLKHKAPYRIDGFDVELSKDHNLPIFQKSYPMYDRFVPYLGELADIHSSYYNNRRKDENSGVIIDIGANCGDTVAALIKHTKGRVLCVEPVPEYYKLLGENVSNMPEEYRNRIITLNAFVGNEEHNWSYETEHGTAHMVSTDTTQNGILIYSLPHAMEVKKIDYFDIDLIKVDTDGYDADCIMSMGNELGIIDPPIFWENLIENEERKNSYDLLVEYLKKNGYESFCVFDNFGNFLIRTDSEGVHSINDYINRFQKGFSGRSFYYVDILAIKGCFAKYGGVINKYLSHFKY